MPGVLGLDLSPSLNGWSYIDGPRTPIADAWEFDRFGDDLGALACAYDDHLDELFRLFDPAYVAYESPILRKWDKLPTLRRIYGLGMATERYCRTRGVIYKEADLRLVKAQLAGDAFADKADMVKAALRLGVILPKTDAAGRKDAADATGVALYGMAEYSPATWAHFDSILNASRGALL